MKPTTPPMTTKDMDRDNRRTHNTTSHSNTDDYTNPTRTMAHTQHHKPQKHQRHYQLHANRVRVPNNSQNYSSTNDVPVRKEVERLLRLSSRQSGACFDYERHQPRRRDICGSLLGSGKWLAWWHACMYVCMCVCMYVPRRCDSGCSLKEACVTARLNVCIHVCICINVHMYVCIYIH